jgi:L-fuculose-phosphate aldolase
MKEYFPLRKQVVLAAKRMAACRLVVGSAGNVSARIPGEDLFIITPSSLSYSDMQAEDTVIVDLEGNVLTEGRPPSMETVIHRKVYTVRPKVGAIYHTHSPYASALAALRVPIPPFLEELVPYIGGPVAVADYAPTASDELAENACKALEDRAAVLLANHGTLCVGADLDRAFSVAELVEEAAQIYVLARSAGIPVELPPESIELHRMMYSFSKTKA